MSPTRRGGERSPGYGGGAVVQGRGLAIGACVVAPFLLGAAAGAPATDGAAFRFTDPDIVESSGLVALPGPPATDWSSPPTTPATPAGSSPSIPPPGDTVGVTSWTPEPDGRRGAGARRSGPRLGGRHRRQPARPGLRRGAPGPGRPRADRPSTPEAYELVYPDGARDAEALLQPPAHRPALRRHQGRLRRHACTPPRCRCGPTGANRLVEVGEAPGIVTDATFLPGRRGRGHADLLRAHLAAYPSWQPVSSWDLPQQDQGEGIALAGRGPAASAPRARGRRCWRSPLPPEAGATDLRSPAWTSLRWLATALRTAVAG